MTGTYSFVLRVRPIQPPGRRGLPRLQFQLEDVAAGMTWHFTRFDDLVQRLSDRVEAIVRRSTDCPEGGDN